MMNRATNPSENTRQQGGLRHIFSRRASWPLKLGRTCALLVGAFYAASFLPGRGLSEPEQAVFSDYFQDSIQYERVRIHTSALASYLIGLRGAEALAIGNTIILKEASPVSSVLESSANDPFLTSNYYLMHEMVHVWQGQNCGGLRLHVHAAVDLVSAVGRGQGVIAAYHYELGQGRDLADFGIEQQASILADYHLLRQTKPADPWYAAPLAGTKTVPSGADLRPLYEQTLRKFKENPAYVRGLCR